MPANSIFAPAALAEAIREYGVRQVADLCGVNQSLPSLWAMRKRPIPAYRLPAVYGALRRHFPRHMDPPTPPESDSGDSGAKPHIQRRHCRLHCKWDAEQDRLLRECLNDRHLTLHEAARVLTAEFGHPRSQDSVSNRNALLGDVRSYINSSNVARLLGSNERTLRKLRKQGRIDSLWIDTKAGPYAAHTDAQVEAFLRAEPWFFDLAAMPRGKWRTLLHVLTRGGTRYIRAPYAYRREGLRPGLVQADSADDFTRRTGIPILWGIRGGRCTPLIEAAYAVQLVSTERRAA
jgi:hypothetical protein